MAVVEVETAAEMLEAVSAATSEADALIMAAAVADYAPRQRTDGKLKKAETQLLLECDRTADILASVAGPKVRVGFAAETDGVIENATRKLRDKRLDLIVANHVGEPESGFASPQNRCIFLDADAGREDLPLLAKREVADRLLDRIGKLLTGAR
jgi:phosphopantothenoylcysteine decarboxylase/phosphopantothenate--cysteine ligase